MNAQRTSREGKDTVESPSLERLRVTITGAVQGVGFRPFVFRLASELSLAGWVLNSSEGVTIEVEGATDQLHLFLSRVESDRPAQSVIHHLTSTWLEPQGATAFEIRHSDERAARKSWIQPDLATCPDCLSEILDESNRRYRYPFTNCTNCGPRYTIIGSLPYDRPATTMRAFTMCPACRAEYGDPRDRRFHAQPNACPDCGPALELWDGAAAVLATAEDALQLAAGALRAGRSVAVKGLGGFHLMVDARDERAVRDLRQRKHRPSKPLAVMYPSLSLVEQDCYVTPLERELLTSPRAPIVLLRRRVGRPETVAPAVAPGNPYLGVMLPYTPLHHLLMNDLGFPVVATSGNLSDEPLCTDEREALERLQGLVDLFLVHNRPILRPVDDSVVRVVAGREMLLRRARGYAPLPVATTAEETSPLLAVGGHLKNTVAFSVGDSIIVSPHIGDLESELSLDQFRATIDGFTQLYGQTPAAVACDAHPGYLSTQHARRMEAPVILVQHHYAHVLSCMAENELDGAVLGISWDGTGYGLDQTIWGGEFLRTTPGSFERVAQLRPFPLPGGEKVSREPRRAALGLLWEMLGEDLFTQDCISPARPALQQDASIFLTMLRRGLNSPYTSSAGRLFDAVASIMGIRHYASYEGQAAMELEFALQNHHTEAAYRFWLRPSTASDTPSPVHAEWIVDWEPAIRQLLSDLREGVLDAEIAGRFHNGLVEAIVTTARLAGEKRVVLTGGCFQNRYLAEQAIARLREERFKPYWHRHVPPNDGGLALGQLVAAQQVLAASREPGESREDETLVHA